MTTMRKVVAILVLVYLTALAAALPALAEEERTSGFITVTDSDTGQIVCRTGRVVYPGDQYLTGNNLLYRVTRIKATTAYADFIRREELYALAPTGWDRLARAIHRTAAVLGLARKDNPTARPVAIYHTHSDESYVPTEGTFSRPGGGGVLAVGEVLADRLRGDGIPVIHSEASHDPHDGLAYERSRRTAIDLLKRNPIALFDIHRDAAPRQEYADRIDNEGVTKIQIVLGTSNPNLMANEAFAKRIKAVVDSKYPGLIKGIWYGQGKYNQDLSPMALLLEFGAQTNSLQSAERGAAIFAAAAESVIITGAVKETRGAWRAFLYLLIGALVAIAAYLALNARSFGDLGRGLGRFFKREFAGVLGNKKRAREAPWEDREREDN